MISLEMLKIVLPSPSFHRQKECDLFKVKQRKLELNPHFFYYMISYSWMNVFFIIHVCGNEINYFYVLKESGYVLQCGDLILILIQTNKHLLKKMRYKRWLQIEIWADIKELYF